MYDKRKSEDKLKMEKSKCLQHLIGKKIKEVNEDSENNFVVIFEDGTILIFTNFAFCENFEEYKEEYT